ncbi:hypothetical protein [Planktothrix sp.]
MLSYTQSSCHTHRMLTLDCHSERSEESQGVLAESSEILHVASLYSG